MNNIINNMTIVGFQIKMIYLHISSNILSNNDANIDNTVKFNICLSEVINLNKTLNAPKKIFIIIMQN